MSVLNTEVSCHTAFWKLEINYKITKIVRALYFAERRVCMRVCKHGCDIKMFYFSRANHASTNLKKVLSWKLRQVYFIHPFPRRLKLGESLETCYVHFFFFAWADILSENHKDWLRLQASCTCKTSRLVRVFLLISALNKKVLLFFSGKLFYKSNRKHFSCVCISWYKHSRGDQAM